MSENKKTVYFQDKNSYNPYNLKKNPYNPYILATLWFWYTNIQIQIQILILKLIYVNIMIIIIIIMIISITWLYVKIRKSCIYFDFKSVCIGLSLISVQNYKICFLTFLPWCFSRNLIVVKRDWNLNKSQLKNREFRKFLELHLC